MERALTLDPLLPFPTASDIVLAPGATDAYDSSRSMPEPGDYFIEPNLQELHGGWHGILPYTRITFTVVG